MWLLSYMYAFSWSRKYGCQTRGPSGYAIVQLKHGQGKEITAVLLAVYHHIS